MSVWIKILVCFLAGAGAGIGTGFAGMSAVAIIAPMLITFLNIDAYTATAIGLASDVLASAVSAYTYKKNKNIDIRNGLVMMLSILVMTVAGSYAADLLPGDMLGTCSLVTTLLLGLKFLVKPVMTTREVMAQVSARTRLIQSLLCGAIIGFICGFVGAGGGLMMLLILTSVLGYELKCAVGTSVFIMSFTALTGAASHFFIGGFPHPLTLSLCIVFTLLWALIAAKLANRTDTKTLNLITGIILLVVGTIVIVVRLLPL